MLNIPDIVTHCDGVKFDRASSGNDWAVLSLVAFKVTLRGVVSGRTKVATPFEVETSPGANSGFLTRGDDGVVGEWGDAGMAVCESSCCVSDGDIDAPADVSSLLLVESDRVALGSGGTGGMTVLEKLCLEEEEMALDLTAALQGVCEREVAAKVAFWCDPRSETDLLERTCRVETASGPQERAGSGIEAALAARSVCSLLTFNVADDLVCRNDRDCETVCSTSPGRVAVCRGGQATWLAGSMYSSAAFNVAEDLACRNERECEALSSGPLLRWLSRRECNDFEGCSVRGLVEIASCQDAASGGDFSSCAK